MAGLVWRQYTQARFGSRAGTSGEELDRALTTGADETSIRVLLNEIIIPIPPGREDEVSRVVEQISQLTSIEQFQQAARQVSASPSRNDGGAIPWRGVTDLPGPLQSLIMALKPGEISRPVPLTGAVALFQLRAMEEVGYRPPPIAALEYAVVRLPGGNALETRERAATLAARADRCDDLFGLLRNEDPSVLELVSQTPAELPRDVAIELSRLDPGEASYALTRNDGQILMMLMLCNRVPELNDGEARDNLILGLRNQRLETLADSFLAQLRADARITIQ